MKKLISAALAASLALSLTACGGNAAPAATEAAKETAAPAATEAAKDAAPAATEAAKEDPIRHKEQHSNNNLSELECDLSSVKLSDETT